MKPNKEGGREPQKEPYVIGLTGTIAAGKSTVRAQLEKRGWPCIDADKVGHAVVEDMKQELAAAFGQEIIEDGHVSRPKLGAIVFGSKEKLARLGALTHPVICRRIEAWIQEQTASVVVVEAIELLHSDLRNMVDETWVVYAQPQVRVKRLMQERGLSEAEAWARVRSQRSDEAYKKEGSISLDGSGDVAQLRAQCTAWAEALEERVQKD